MAQIEYLPSESTKKLDDVIEVAKAEIEHRIRHIVQRFGGFKLTVEDGPRRADDQLAGIPFEAGDAVRITIRPKLGKGRR